MGYVVYKHVFPNQKIYIGITRRIPEIRWGYGGNGYRDNAQMWNAIKKYGWENIEHIILYENKTEEEASQIEQQLIAEYKSNQREFGYNIQKGGTSGSSYYFDEEYMVELFQNGMNLQEIARQIGCCSRTASEILRRNGIETEEIRRRSYEIIAEKERTPSFVKDTILSLFHEGYLITEIIEETDCCYSVVKQTLTENGITHEDIMKNYCVLTEKDIPQITKLINDNKTLGEIAAGLQCSVPVVGAFINNALPFLKEKVKENRYAKIIQSSCKSIKQYDLHGNYIKTFSSASEAARAVSSQEKIGNSHIIQCCRGTQKTAYGFIWRYEVDTENILLTSSKANRAVKQFDLQGNYLRTFNTIREAAELLKVSPTGIGSACRGIQQTCGGYKWKYANQDYSFIERGRKKVEQYTLDNIFIQSFSSMQEASRITGVRADTISAVCRGKQKSSGGFLWRYADNDILD